MLPPFGVSDAGRRFAKNRAKSGFPQVNGRILTNKTKHKTPCVFRSILPPYPLLGESSLLSSV